MFRTIHKSTGTFSTLNDELDKIATDMQHKAADELDKIAAAKLNATGFKDIIEHILPVLPISSINLILRSCKEMQTFIDNADWVWDNVPFVKMIRESAVRTGDHIDSVTLFDNYIRICSEIKIGEYAPESPAGINGAALLKGWHAAKQFRPDPLHGFKIYITDTNSTEPMLLYTSDEWNVTTRVLATTQHERYWKDEQVPYVFLTPDSPHVMCWITALLHEQNKSAHTYEAFKRDVQRIQTRYNATHPAKPRVLRVIRAANQSSSTGSNERAKTEKRA